MKKSPGKMEAALGGEPGQREDEQRDGERDAQPVATRVPREGDAPRRAAATVSASASPTPAAGSDVDPAGVQVALVDDARTAVTRAEHDRRPDERPRPAGNRRERDRAERKRVVEEHERPVRAPGQIASLVDVVERLGRQPRVGERSAAAWSANRHQTATASTGSARLAVQCAP